MDLRSTRQYSEKIKHIRWQGLNVKFISMDSLLVSRKTQFLLILHLAGASVINKGLELSTAEIEHVHQPTRKGAFSYNFPSRLA